MCAFNLQLKNWHCEKRVSGKIIDSSCSSAKIEKVKKICFFLLYFVFTIIEKMKCKKGCVCVKIANDCLANIYELKFLLWIFFFFLKNDDKMMVSSCLVYSQKSECKKGCKCMREKLPIIAKQA